MNRPLRICFAAYRGNMQCGGQGVYLYFLARDAFRLFRESFEIRLEHMELNRRLEKALEASNATSESMREGVELTLRQLRAAFDKGRLAEINPAGEKFDPHNHQAISMVPAEAAGGVPANHVVSVLQKGWRIADRVLRPALVTVASA